MEINNILRVDPTPRGVDPRQVPLFRTPSTNQPLRTNDMLALVRKLVGSVGMRPEEFGTHSLRIGGATALFASGADPTVIRTMGRWSSDIYRLYCRASYERCLDWTRRAGSAYVTDVIAHFDEVDHY